MTDSGNNPFAEPDFSALQGSGGQQSDGDYDDEYVEDEEGLADDDLEDEDDEVEDDELEDDADEETDEGEQSDSGEVFVEPTASLEVEEDDAGNRMEGGTARAVLEHVARSIVDDPDGVTIEVGETRSGVRLSLHVAQGDMGRIIGRRGRTAQALRTLVRAAAARDGQEASVDIVD
jgi:predicted RNA-binding protein YlqC (UPF0109 family)